MNTGLAECDHKKFSFVCWRYEKSPVVKSLCHLTLLLDSNGQADDKEYYAHHDSNIMLSCKDLQNPIFTDIGLSSKF